MITISGHDKLFTMSEAVKNVREYLAENVSEMSEDSFNIVVACLAAALNEDVDFMRGALKVGGVPCTQ